MPDDKKPELKVIKGATLITGTGQDPIQDTWLVIEGDRIKAIEKTGSNLPEEAVVIDAAGKFILPGLIDSHVHLRGMATEDMFREEYVVPERLCLLRASQHAHACLKAGFTTIRDCGSTHALYIKKAIEEGTLPGPRIVASGFILSQTFGHSDDHFLPPEWVDYRHSGQGHTLIADGPAECRKAARFALRQGADFIKICTSGGIMSEKDRPEHVQFSLDEIEAIAEAARFGGAFVASHAQNTTAVRNAITGGVKTIEHGFGVDDETIDLARQKEVIFVPTLSLDRAIIDGGVAAGFAPWAVQKQTDAWDREIEDTRRLYRAGVIIAAGTDFLGSPLSRMGDNARELELLVKYCGFKPMDVIVAATRNGARACGLDYDIGTIEEGKLADLIVVSKDLLADIKTLQDPKNIKAVFKGGDICINRGL